MKWILSIPTSDFPAVVHVELGSKQEGLLLAASIEREHPEQPLEYRLQPVALEWACDGSDGCTGIEFRRD